MFYYSPTKKAFRKSKHSTLDKQEIKISLKKISTLKNEPDLKQTLRWQITKKLKLKIGYDFVGHQNSFSRKIPINVEKLKQVVIVESLWLVSLHKIRFNFNVCLCTSK